MPVTLPVVVPRDLSIDSRAEMIPRRNPITTRTTRTPIETQTFSHRFALIIGAAISGEYAAGRCAIVQFSLFTRRGIGILGLPRAVRVEGAGGRPDGGGLDPDRVGVLQDAAGEADGVVQAALDRRRISLN